MYLGSWLDSAQGTQVAPSQNEIRIRIALDFLSVKLIEPYDAARKTGMV